MAEADLAIIGAGPAGLAAAAAGASYGLRTVVLDEAPQVGGRLLGQLYRHRGHWWIGRDIAASLADEVVHHGAQIRLSSAVYGLYEGVGAGFPWMVQVDPGPSLRTRALIIATGAVEVPVPLPGWTLPGVMTIGAAQVLTNVHQVRPGRHGLVVGFSPLSFAIAQELRWAGISLAGIVMAPPDGLLPLGGADAEWQRVARMGRLAPSLYRLGAWLVGQRWARQAVIGTFPRAGVPWSGVPIRLATTAVALLGDEEVTGVRLASLDGRGRTRAEWIEAVDFVCLSGGLSPLTDVMALAGLPLLEASALGGEVPLTSPYLETPRPGVFVAGNATGIEGAGVAIAQGHLAGLSAARFLAGSSPTIEGAIEEAARAERQARSSAPFEFHAGISEARRALHAQWRQWQRSTQSENISEAESKRPTDGKDDSS